MTICLLIKKGSNITTNVNFNTTNYYSPPLDCLMAWRAWRDSHCSAAVWPVTVSAGSGTAGSATAGQPAAAAAAAAVHSFLPPAVNPGSWVALCLWKVEVEVQLRRKAEEVEVQPRRKVQLRPRRRKGPVEAAAKIQNIKKVNIS